MRRIANNSRARLRARCDKLVGDYCRAKGRCEICGSTHQLQWAHLVTRRVIKLRYEPNNFACLCNICHRWYEGTPTQLEGIWDNLKGRGTVDWLRAEAAKVEPLGADFYEAIIQKYQWLST